MTFRKALLTMSAAFCFLKATYGQVPASIPVMEPVSEYASGIPKPSGKPNFEFSMKIEMKTIFGYITPIKVGTAEIRDSSIYANLLFGHYQLLFEQVNDSTFVEHMFNSSLTGSTEKYELFVTVKRGDKLILKDYHTTKGEERKEKQLLENKVYAGDFVTVVTAANKLFSNTLEGKVDFVAFGVPYTFTITKEVKEEKNKNIITKKVNYKADMSTVTRDPDDLMLLERYLNIFTEEQDGRIIPLKFEGEVTATNMGLLNGMYRASGVKK